MKTLPWLARAGQQSPQQDQVPHLLCSLFIRTMSIEPCRFSIELSSINTDDGNCWTGAVALATD
jgi:hypothetical protein